MDEALKEQVIDICEVRNSIISSIDRYGKVTTANLEANKSRMNEPIDITQTNDVFFKRIDNCIQYADDDEIPFTHQQILQTAYHSVSTCGHYNDA